MLQRNLTKIEGNVTELEAKLKHEQDKFKMYNKDLKEAEKRCACYVTPNVQHAWWACLVFERIMSSLVL